MWFCVGHSARMQLGWKSNRLVAKSNEICLFPCGLLLTVIRISLAHTAFWQTHECDIMIRGIPNPLCDFPFDCVNCSCNFVAPIPRTNIYKTLVTDAPNVLHSTQCIPKLMTIYTILLWNVWCMVLPNFLFIDLNQNGNDFLIEMDAIIPQTWGEQSYHIIVDKLNLQDVHKQQLTQKNWEVDLRKISNWNICSLIT